MNTFKIIAHPENASQVEAIKAVLKALKIKFEVSKDKSYNLDFVKSEQKEGDTKQAIIKNITKGSKELKNIKEGKLTKKNSLKEFLNEL